MIATNSGSRTKLDDLLDDLANRMQSGETVDLNVVIRDHPEHASEIRRLLPAIQVLANLPRSGEPGASAPGDALGDLGDYRLIREVGRGGMGVVYEAEQISLGRSVALKVLPFASTMDERHLQRFKNEARAAASLHHEHIVPVYAVGCERGVHYYAMQFVEGRTLAQVIFDFRLTIDDCKSNAPADSPGTSIENHQSKIENETIAALSTKRDKTRYRAIAALIADAGDALEYAHSMGIVHRDVKPGNLMLDAAGKLWVTDFGLARMASPGREAGVLTVSGDIIGTLRYMAPEQALAKHGLADHRVDVYGLGATLYELLSGKPAVRGNDKQEILKAIAFEEPIAPRKLDKHIPAELETISLKCLAKEPGERYASAGELAADLRRWVEDKAIKAKPPGWRERAVKWAWRHKHFVGSAVAILGVTLVAVSVAAWQMSHERNSALAQKQLADERLTLSWNVVNDMYLQVAKHWLENEPNFQPHQRRFVEQTVHYFEIVAKQLDGEPDFQLRRAEALDTLGTLYKKTNENAKARDAFGRAIDIVERLSEQNPESANYRFALASITINLGSLLYFPIGETAAAEQRLRRAVALLTKLVQDQPENTQYLYNRAAALKNLALTLETTPEAEELLRESVAVCEALGKKHPEMNTGLGATLDSLARHLALKGDFESARPLLMQAIDYDAAIVRKSPQNQLARFHFANHYCNLSNVLTMLRQPAEAEKAIRQDIKLREQLVVDYPNNAAYRRTLADSKRRLTDLLKQDRRPQ